MLGRVTLLVVLVVLVVLVLPGSLMLALLPRRQVVGLTIR